MDRRFSLVLVVAFLIGGAVVLWLSPQPHTSLIPTATTPPSATPPIAATAGEGTFGLYTLAVSWQPAFCETEPGKPECRSLIADRYDADHFALHGFWPQDDYCGVSPGLIDADNSGPRSSLPEVALSDAIRTALARVMPGTQSMLERHEWLVHGTCSGVAADTYYARAVTLIEQLNASPVRELFARSVGEHISEGAVRAAFDAAFGKGAGRRVRVDCASDGSRTLIVELRIRLYGDVMGPVGFGALISRANPGSGGCSGGEIDLPGNQ